MNDEGFNGAGSRFNSRFEAGSPILAKQLNDLAAGLQASLPMPYLGDGAVVSYTPGGSMITSTDNEMQKEGTALCAGEIYGLYYDETEDKYYISITPFHVNNLVVTDHDDNPLTDSPPPKIQVFTGGISTDPENPTKNYIYVACEASDDTAEADYPVSDPPPYIVVSADLKTDTKEVAFLLLGIVTGWNDPDTDVDTLDTLNMKGCGSLMTARLMCGSGDPTYFWSSV